MGVKITGIGVAYPDNIITNEQLARELKQRQTQIEKGLKDKKEILLLIREGLDPGKIKERVSKWLADQERKTDIQIKQFNEDKERDGGQGSQFLTDNKWIRERVGVSERHIALPHQTTTDLAKEAAERALEMSGLDKKYIEAIVFATVTPDYFTSPPSASVLQDKLGIPVYIEVEEKGEKKRILKEIFVFDATAACTSFSAGLNIAHSLIESKKYKNVLLIGADIMSRVINLYNRYTLGIFGDAGTSWILEECPDSESSFLPNGFYCGSDGSKAERIIVPVGGAKFPITPEVIEIITNPFDQSHKVKMEGNLVFKEIVKRVRDEVIPAALKKANLRKKDIKLMIFHQANLRMIRAIGWRGRVYNNIDRFGNTTSASVSLCFYEAYQKGLIKPGDIVCFTLFGGGYTWNVFFIKTPYLEMEKTIDKSQKI